MVDSLDQHRQKHGSHTSIPAGPQVDHKLGVRDSFKPDYGQYQSPEFPQGHYYRAKSGKKIKVRTRYKTGDEYILASRSPEEIAQVQQSLSQAGLLKPGTFQPLANDAKTRSAMTELLSEANAAGMRWGDYLDQRVAMAKIAPSGAGATKAPLVLQLSNADTITSGVKNDATSILGSTAAAGDPQHYVDEIHAAETKQQTDAYNESGAGFAGGTGGTTIEAPTVDALLAKEHPAEAQTNQVLGSNAQQFINLLGGGVGG